MELEVLKLRLKLILIDIAEHEDVYPGDLLPIVEDAMIDAVMSVQEECEARRFHLKVVR